MGKVIGTLIVILILIVVVVFLFRGIFSGGIGLGLSNPRATGNNETTQSQGDTKENQSQNAGNQNPNENEIVLKIDIQGTEVFFENTKIQSLDALATRIQEIYKEADENDKIRVVILSEVAIYKTVNDVKTVLSKNNIDFTIE